MKRTKTNKEVDSQTGELQLLGLRLIESSSKLGEMKPDALPGRARQSINFVVMISEDLKNASVNGKIKLDISYDSDETKDSAITVFASFSVGYSIVKAFPNKDALEKFLQENAILNIWPYWREFVQSMTTRMGLPSFSVPLIYADKILKGGGTTVSKLD